MKKIPGSFAPATLACLTAFASFALPSFAFATGGFECVGDFGNETRLVVSASTSHAFGTLASDVFVSVVTDEGKPVASLQDFATGELVPEIKVARANVVQFWNDGESLLLLAVDAERTGVELRIKATGGKDAENIRGKVTVVGQRREVVDVVCQTNL